MNSTSEVHSEFGEGQLTVMKVATIVTTIFGTLGNSLTIAAILKGRHYTHMCYVFIMNLSVVNLLHCTLVHPFLTAQAFNGIWTHDKLFCDLFSYWLFCTLGAELWGYVCITLNRYFCVVHTSLYPRIYTKKKHIVGQLVFSWMFYPVFLMLPLVGAWGEFQYAPQKLVCHPFANYNNCTGFCLFIFIVALMSTVPVLLYCYPAIIVTYVNSQKKIGFSRDVSRTRSHRSELSPRPDPEVRKCRSEIKMTFTILAVILVFGICRLPFMLLYLYDPSVTKVAPIVHTVLIYFGSSSNWINPFIYSFSSAKIRTTLKSMRSSLKIFHSRRESLTVKT